MYTLTKRVLPQHTDYAGVMWHGAYVQWLEEARVEALQAAGLGYAVMTAMGVDMPVVSLALITAMRSGTATKCVLKANALVSRGCAGHGSHALSAETRWLRRRR